MPAPTAKFLMELLEAEVLAIEAIEGRLADHDTLTARQAETLRILQNEYVHRCEQLQQAISEQN